MTTTAPVDPLLVHATPMAEAYHAFSRAVFAPDAVVPLKYRELAAIAVAVTTQCEGCIRAHSTAAVGAGASDAEIAEIVMVAAALRAGGGAVHGRKALAVADRARGEDHTH